MTVKVVAADYCPYCRMALQLLTNKGLTFEHIDVTNNPELKEQYKKETGMSTIPQVFIKGKLIGGYSELSALNTSGKLDKMLG